MSKIYAQVVHFATFYLQIETTMVASRFHGFRFQVSWFQVSGFHGFRFHGFMVSGFQVSIGKAHDG